MYDYMVQITGSILNLQVIHEFHKNMLHRHDIIKKNSLKKWIIMLRRYENELGKHF